MGLLLNACETFFHLPQDRILTFEPSGVLPPLLVILFSFWLHWVFWVCLILGAAVPQRWNLINCPSQVMQDVVSSLRLDDAH